MQFLNYYIVFIVQFPNDTLAKELEIVSAEVQKSVKNSADQTLENLTRIDNILSNVADIGNSPDQGMISLSDDVSVPFSIL